MKVIKRGITAIGRYYTWIKHNNGIREMLPEFFRLLKVIGNAFVIILLASPVIIPIIRFLPAWCIAFIGGVVGSLLCTFIDSKIPPAIIPPFMPYDEGIYEWMDMRGVRRKVVVYKFGSSLEVYWNGGYYRVKPDPEFEKITGKPDLACWDHGRWICRIGDINCVTNDELYLTFDKKYLV